MHIRHMEYEYAICHTHGFATVIIPNTSKMDTTILLVQTHAVSDHVSSSQPMI